MQLFFGEVTATTAVPRQRGEQAAFVEVDIDIEIFPLPTTPVSLSHPSLSQRLVALIGKLRYCRRLAAGRNPLLVRYAPDGQRKDADTLSPPLDHPDILLQVFGRRIYI